MQGNGVLSGTGQLRSLFGRGDAAFTPHGGGLHHRAAQGGRELGGIDLVAVFLHHIHHVEGDHDRKPQLQKLCSEVQVPLDVGGVHQVQDDIGTFMQQIVPGHDLFQGVGGQGVDTGKIHDGDILVPLQTAFLFFHCNAGPVSDKLIGPGEGVEHGGLATVRVARKGNGYGHFFISSSAGWRSR